MFILEVIQPIEFAAGAIDAGVLSSHPVPKSQIREHCDKGKTALLL